VYRAEEPFYGPVTKGVTLPRSSKSLTEPQSLIVHSFNVRSQDYQSLDPTIFNIHHLAPRPSCFMTEKMNRIGALIYYRQLTTLTIFYLRSLCSSFNIGPYSVMHLTVPKRLRIDPIHSVNSMQVNSAIGPR